MYSRDGSRSWRVLKREHCSSRRQQFSGQSSLPLGLVPFARLGLTPTSGRESEREGGGEGEGRSWSVREFGNEQRARIHQEVMEIAIGRVPNHPTSSSSAS